MWFAFNSGYYDLWLQLILQLIMVCTVVICFQFWILRSLITTFLGQTVSRLWLWFAFNSGYYDLWLQLSFLESSINGGCDLLSILDITIFDYNIQKWRHKHPRVVICFQFWILRSLITTLSLIHIPMLTLWFAFNSGYYDLWLQPNVAALVPTGGCDLLSILDITIFDYN